jgi:CubicO group peptidase (beta-lactamase class C family)
MKNSKFLFFLSTWQITFILPTCNGGGLLRLPRELLSPEVDNLTAVDLTLQLVDAYNQSNMYNATFSGVLKVVVDGESRFQQAMGIVDEEHQLPMTMDSVFPIGSNTKLLTAVALYQLQEQGKVNLSQPINDDLTQEDFAKFGFPNQTYWCPQLQDTPNEPCIKITYEQLLSMSSGIGNKPKDYYHAYMGSVEAHVGLFINNPLLFMPGTNFTYSNPSYILATYMIEKFSGMKFGDYVRVAIFEPLGLQNTFYDPYDGQVSTIKNYADQYWRFFANDTGEELGTGACRVLSSGSAMGAGGILASIDDVITWYLDLFSNHGTTSKVLSESSINQLLRPWTPVNFTFADHYGQGIFVKYPFGITTSTDWPALIGHGGNTICANSAIFMQILSNESSTVSAAISNNCIVLLNSNETYDDLKQTFTLDFLFGLTSPLKPIFVDMFEPDEEHWFQVYGGNEDDITFKLLDIWTMG